jgi:ribosomal protein S12 methylthiotransferase
MKKKPAVGIVSLGCPRNVVDSESILGRLHLKGYPIVDLENADIGIVNTCAFIDDAKKESIEAILALIDLKKKGTLKKIIVYGCLSQRYRQALAKELPQIDAFVGRVSLNHDTRVYTITPRHSVYLKICEGCVNHCSYCVIPHIKGKFTSLDEKSVVEQVKRFDAERVSELTIVGQDITGYGFDSGRKNGLAGLLKKILPYSGHIPWVRLLYLYPSRITDELVRVIADSPRVCKYIDMPIQHMNDRILARMNRKTRKSDIMKIIEKVRRRIPQVALRTSVIVGFPSETEKEFQELLHFVKEMQFERLGAFMYSREEGTVAYSLPRQVPTKEKVLRFDTLMAAQQEVASEVNQKFLGKRMEVIIDEKTEDGYLGRTQFDAPEVDGVVYVSSSRALKQGDIVRVDITDTLEYDLVGKAM